MKYLFAIMIALALMVAPVWAAEGDPAEGEEEQQAEQQTAEAVTVSTFDELQAAVDAAEDGATITVAQTITVNGQRLVTEKDITLTRAEGMSGAMIDLWNGGEISGFSFVESGAESSYSTISIDYCYNSAAEIDNCNFSKEEGAASYINLFGNIFSDDPNSALISGCNFTLSAGRAIDTRNHTHITLDGCNFTAQGGGIAWVIDNEDTAIITDCAIVGSGTDSFSIRNSGTMQLENTTITRDNRENKAVFDIFLTTKSNLTITSCGADDGIYSLATKAALKLPLTDYSGMLQLVYLTEDEAAAYFAPDEPEDEPEDEAPIDNPVDEPQDTPDDPTDDEQEDNPADEQPEQPTDDPQPPETPQDEPQQEQGNDPADTPAEPPARENEPTAPEDQTEDKPAAQEQQEIEQIDDSEQDGAEDNTEDNTEDEQTAPAVEEQPQDTTPAEEKPQPQPEQPREYISYTPIYTPIWDDSDSGNDKEDTPTAPAVEVAAVVPEGAVLVCGGATMDTTRRVELAGYGDGDLHLEDSLTRAQMATIIYRLLDAATIEQYSNSAASFADVPSGAWYTPYVQLISSAGIVQGVGGGKYEPDSTVTWAQTIVLLSRFVEGQDHTLQYITCPAWAQNAMQTAVYYRWIEDSAEFDAAAEITRGEFAELVNTVLDMVA